MSDSFNGYHVWLGIPPSEQPPNHYRLLGIAAFETDLDVIDHAADRQMAHVRTFQSGRNGGLSQQILNELAAARVCLLNVQRKTEYDDALRAKLSTITVGSAVPIAGAVPVAVAVPIAQPAIATPVLVKPTAVPANPNQSGIHSAPAKVAPTKAAGGPTSPAKSGTYAMPPNLQTPIARGAQPGSPSGSPSGSSSNLSGSSPNLSGVAPARPVAPVKPAANVKPPGAAPVKPAGATPPPRPAAAGNATAGNAAAAKPVAAAPVSATPADDDDPYGLSAASRRPLASRNAAEDDEDDDLDDLTIRHKVGGGVDLSLRTGSRDALVQKLAIYGFVVVAVLVVILVTKNVVERNYGPINELFNHPTVEQPVATEPKPIHAPAAPLPAPAAGEIVDDGTEPNATDPSADPNAADPNAIDATGSGVGNSKDGIPAVQPPSGLETPSDLDAPPDASDPQLEVTPAAPSGR